MRLFVSLLILVCPIAIADDIDWNWEYWFQRQDEQTQATHKDERYNQVYRCVDQWIQESEHVYRLERTDCHWEDL